MLPRLRMSSYNSSNSDHGLINVHHTEFTYCSVDGVKSTMLSNIMYTSEEVAYNLIHLSVIVIQELVEEVG